MGFHGISWDLMGFHGISWDLMGFHGISWDLMGFHGISWDFMGFHGISWDFMGFHVGTLYGQRTEGSATRWSPERQVSQSDHITPYWSYTLHQFR